MRKFVTGDMHGEHSINKFNMHGFPIQKELGYDDIMFITGDFGLLWEPKQSAQEKYWLNWISKRYTVCFIDGNHENFTRINKLYEVDFYGGKAGVVQDRIYHLKRGEIYNFDGTIIFTFGGAMSTDKEHRTEHLTWWKEEEPSWAECDYALSNLDKVDNKVDIVLTHTAPATIVAMMGIDARTRDPAAIFLNNVAERIKFKQWYFGHMHVEETYGNFRCLYNDIIEI